MLITTETSIEKNSNAHPKAFYKKTNMKPFWCVVAIFMSIYFLWFFLSYFVVSAVNYNENRKIYTTEITGTISNQNIYSNIKYGWGTIKANGCGVVALYNIMELENRHQNFLSMVTLFEKYGSNFHSLLGTNGISMGLYLISKGYRVNYVFDASIFVTESQNSKYTIFCYIMSTYGHYELLTDFNGTDFQMYNPTYRTTIEHQMEITDNSIFRCLICVN